MSHHRFEHSSPSVQKNLSLFHLPPTELGVEKVQWVDYKPSSKSEDGPIEFTISGAGHQYIDLQNTRLFVRAKIVKDDGSKIPLLQLSRDAPFTASNMNPDAFVGPVNLWLHSLFNQVDLLMQQKVVNSSNLYPYRSYFETLIYPYERFLGESELFFKDSFDDMESTKILGENVGFNRRSLRTAQSIECDMEGPLHIDLCKQDRYIMNGVDIGLRLWYTDDSFRLMSEIGDCKVLITDAVLKVCKVNIAPSVMATHNQIMKHAMTAKYPYERTEMKTFAVSPGQQAFSEEDVFQGEVPNKVVMALVSSTSFYGSYTGNPYNFKHASISKIGVKIDNTPVPAQPLVTKFGEYQNAASAFRALFEDNPDLDITRDEYENGYTMFSFTTRKGSHETLNTLQKGNFSIEIKFSEETEERYTLVIMAKMPHVMEIDVDRRIIV